MESRVKERTCVQMREALASTLDIHVMMVSGDIALSHILNVWLANGLPVRTDLASLLLIYAFHSMHRQLNQITKAMHFILRIRTN